MCDVKNNLPSEEVMFSLFGVSQPHLVHLNSSMWILLSHSAFFPSAFTRMAAESFSRYSFIFSPISGSEAETLM